MIRVESSIDLDQPADAVFAFVTDASNDPLWHTVVREAARVSDGPIGLGSEFLWVVSFTGREEAIVRITEFKPAEYARLEATFRGARSALTYLLVPQDGGTRFTRTLEMRMRGPLRLVEPFIRSRVGKGNVSFLANLRQALSSERS